MNIEQMDMDEVQRVYSTVVVFPVSDDNRVRHHVHIKLEVSLDAVLDLCISKSKWSQG